MKIRKTPFIVSKAILFIDKASSKNTKPDTLSCLAAAQIVVAGAWLKKNK